MHHTLDAPPKGPVTRPAPPVPETPARRLMITLLVAGWAAGVLWRLWLSRDITLPIAHPDEDAYLDTARALAGGPGGHSSENALLRRVGYPLLLSPAYLVGTDFPGVYRLVQLINALANAALLPLVYLLGRRMLGLPRPTAYLAALAAATLPAAVFYAPLAMTEAVLAPLLLGWLLALHHWLRAPGRAGRAVAVGVIAGAVYTLHVRGLVVLGLTLVVAGLLRARRIAPAGAALAAVAAALPVAAANHVVIALLGDAVQLTGTAPGGQTLAGAASGAGSLRLLAMIGTNLWYLVAVTFGLAGLGWLQALRLMRGGDRPQRWAVGAAAAATAGVTVGSAVILAGVDPAALDVLYARYVHLTAPLWLLMGLHFLLAGPARRAAAVLATVAVLGAGAWLIALRMWRADAAGHPMEFGTFGAADLMALAPSWRYAMVALTGAAVAAGGCVLLAAASGSRRLHRPVVLAVVLANLVCMQLVADRQLRVAAARQDPVPLLSALGVRPGDRVAADDDVPAVHRRPLAHQVRWAQVPLFGTQPPPTATVVLARWDPGRPAHWDGTRFGFSHVGGNPGQHWAVWRRS